MHLSLFDELRREFSNAKTSNDANSQLAALATCGSDGRPSVRTVVIHEISQDGILLMISKYHQKWKQLCENPQAELLLWWRSLGLQYRISGECVEQSPETAKERWLHLSEAVRRLDIAYDDAFLPGHPISSMQAVSENVEQSSAGKCLNEMPDHVCAIRLIPKEIERLKVSPSDRQHDRSRATSVDGEWERIQIIP